MFMDGFEELVPPSSGYKSKSNVEENSTDRVRESDSGDRGGLSDPIGLRRMVKGHEALERAKS
jgi:hypothetical protein